VKAGTGQTTDKFKEQKAKASAPLAPANSTPFNLPGSAQPAKQQPAAPVKH